MELIRLKSFLMLALIFGSSSFVLCQTDQMSFFFPNQMPSKVDTLYFPFYNGVQMIELDHIGFWDKKIFYLEQSEPRAMPHSMYHPMPLGNEYYFRDSNGEILKVYNTSQSLKSIKKHFSSIPIDKKNTSSVVFSPSHSGRDLSLNGVWAYSPQSMFSFNGYYKVFEPGTFLYDQTGNPKFGLIDTLGNLKIPMVYENILPLLGDLIVKQKGKWGIIDKDQKKIVPLVYDRYNNYYSSPDNNKVLYFIKEAKYVALYDVQEKTLFHTKGYDAIYDYYKQFGYFLIRENNLYGLIDLQGKEVLPPIYNRVNNMNTAACTYNYCVSVTLNGETFDVELEN